MTLYYAEYQSFLFVNEGSVDR